MAKRWRYFCAACRTNRRLHLHHMIYPPDIWQTTPDQCCWLCDRCHETFHRAPAKYIAMARTEGITAMVVRAQRDEEDGMLSMRDWVKSSSFLRSIGLRVEGR